MILAIDSSTKWIGIAIFDGNAVIYEKIWTASRRHTVELSPAIDAAFKESNQSVNALSAVAAAIGPGSFTSLRIGLAIAKGFALSLHIPIIGIPSLDILASAVPPQDKPLICVLRAGRGRLAAQHYHVQDDKWISVGELEVSTAKELESIITEPTIVCGELDADENRIISRRWRNAIILDPPANLRRPSILALIASHRLQAGNVSDSASIAPIYLRTVKNIDQ